ncbi:MAG TPA: hypothetical protein VGN11_12190 [Candidatus Baltobacteraceae bacterium]|nr:hypothetical protein [Candidatus Baltobacteraceae bacterium]
MVPVDPGRRVQIVSGRPRYNGKTGTITSVTVSYTVALDELLEMGEHHIIEVRAGPHQVRLIDERVPER